MKQYNYVLFMFYSVSPLLASPQLWISKADDGKAAKAA
jgi:hypothetical protein